MDTLTLVPLFCRDDWREEARRRKARATIAGYQRDKRHLQAAIERELAAVKAAQQERAAHLKRIPTGMKGMARKVREEYDATIGQHRREVNLARYYLRELEQGYAAALALVGEEKAA